MEIGQGSGDCSDLISNLPDELLGCVLSFLPTKHAVSTSILSKRWRYLFTLTHSLSFDIDSCLAPFSGSTEIYEPPARRLKKIVYKVLEQHQFSPIKKFRLVYRSSHETDVRAWIISALKKGVEELDCDIGSHVALPDSVFVCETLVKLRIASSYRCFQRETPVLFRLPNLKILNLNSVKDINHDSPIGLFRGCELLEELTLENCSGGTGCRAKISSAVLKVLTIVDCNFPEGLLEIEAPNLSDLTYSFNTNVKIVSSWKKSSSFVKTKLSFEYANRIRLYNLHELDHNSHQYDIELIKAAAHKAIYLRLMSDSLEVLLSLADHEEMPRFDSLKILRVGRCPYYTWKALTNLMDKSPQLETVIFEWGLHYCDCVPSPAPYAGRIPLSCQCYCDRDSLPSDEALLPFSCHAKVIIVNGFCEHKCSMLLVGHILRNARNLKRLILSDCTRYHKDEEVPWLSKELVMLSRASPDCCIELKLDTYALPSSYVNSWRCMRFQVSPYSLTTYRSMNVREDKHAPEDETSITL